MLDKILKLEGVEKLNKKEQKSIIGGFEEGVIECGLVPDGTPCVHRITTEIGVCQGTVCVV